MQEKIVENKQCKHCDIIFEITDKDLEFYDKISPKFNGEKFQIWTPNLCSLCRRQRRYTFRNEWKLYKRKCDFSWKDIISIYSPNKEIIVYDSDIWWWDSWDALNYGINYDNNKSFFEQFSELMKKVPFQNAYITRDSENSLYWNHIWKMKDCYLCFASWICEKTMYSSQLMNATYVLDSTDWTNLEKCYQTINCEWCFGLFYSINSNNCTNSYFLYNCQDCTDCFLCYDLVWKKYYIKNKEYSKEDYYKKIKELKEEYFVKWWWFISEIKDKTINKNLLIINSENSLWDNLKNCNNVSYSYHISEAENCKYIENWWIVCNNTYDWYWVWEDLDLWYEIIDTWVNAILSCFNGICHECSYTFYSFNCHNNCSNLFGCIWLKNKEYCILNKQYSKKEYEKIVPQIINNMKKNNEWWEFFSSKISPFGYNETVANEYFPLTKNEALNNWYNWSDYEVPFPKVEKIIPANKLPNSIDKIPDDILNWAIKCEKTNKPFKIVPLELKFYRDNDIPIPQKSPEERHLERKKISNPKEIYGTKCDKCWIEIKSVFSKESWKKVYCEECYNKEVY